MAFPDHAFRAVLLVSDLQGGVAEFDADDAPGVGQAELDAVAGEPEPAGRRGQFQDLLGVARLLHARHRGNLTAVAEQARRLQTAAEAPDAMQPGLGEELRALALISLGSTEFWAARFREAVRHLEQGVALARRIGRSYLEFSGLAYQARAEIFQSSAAATEHSGQAIELAKRHGWTDEPAAGLAYGVFGTVLAWQGRPEEAEAWIQHAERIAGAEPIAGTGVGFGRVALELGRGRDAEALAAARAAEPLVGLLAAPNPLITMAMRAFQLQIQVRLGETERAEQALAGLDGHDRERGDVRIAAAVLRLAQDDPHAAVAALAPVLDGSAQVVWPARLAQAFLLEAIARDRLGDEASAGRALERALDLAEPDGALLWFVLHPAPGLLERQARHRTAHPALVAEILGRLSGNRRAPPPGPQLPIEPLSESELRVLRYLPTNLTGPEIAGELYVSLNTIRTHMRHLYAKLGTHRRAEAVACARDLGLLAPSPHRGQAARAG